MMLILMVTRYFVATIIYGNIIGNILVIEKYININIDIFTAVASKNSKVVD